MPGPAGIGYGGRRVRMSGDWQMRRGGRASHNGVSEKRWEATGSVPARKGAQKMIGMGRLWRVGSSLAMAGAFAGVTLISGCAARGSYRVYDPDYREYHRWNRSEEGYYVRWENETHRRHRDFRDRDRRDQDDYWRWRHDHDRDHRDRDRGDHPHR